MKSIAKILAILCLALALDTGQVAAQNTCATASALTQTCTTLNLSNGSNWYSVVPSGTTLRVTWSATLGNTTLNIHSGLCNATTLIASGTPEPEGLVANLPVIAGNTYFIEIQNSGSASSGTLCQTSLVDLLYPCDCDTSLFPSNPLCDMMCNGSLEHIADPDGNPNNPNPLTYAEINKACPFEQLGPIANAGSVDLFSTTGAIDVDVPQNYMGWQTPNNGNSYAGFYTYQSTKVNGREYVAAKLLYDMPAGQKFNVSFYVSLANYSGYAGRNIGADFVTSLPSQGPNAQYIPPQTPLTVVESNYITDTTNWVLISGVYTATGGEEYIMIGNFETDAAQLPIPVTPSDTVYSSYTAAFYYIDNISITPIIDPLIVSDFDICPNETVYITEPFNPMAATITWSSFFAPFACDTSDCSRIFSNPTSTNVYASTVIIPFAKCTINNGAMVTVNGGLSFTYRAGCPSLFTHQFPCPSDSILTWSWFFDDPNSGASNTSTLPNPYHSFTSTGTIHNVTLTVTTVNGQTLSVTIQVVSPLPPDASIVGALYNDCSSGFQHYEPLNQPNIVYNWVNVVGDISHVLVGTGIDINWSTNGGYVVLLATDTVTDCQSFDTLTAPPCCNSAGIIELNSRTAKSVLTDPTLQQYITGTDFHPTSLLINGLFVIDTTFSLSNVNNLYMGANTIVDILPTQSLTISNCKITQKCNYMWDGIYINGDQANLSITNGSELQQAKNCVVSVNGGNYLIENSILKNNIKGVVVKAYQNQHQGVIKNTVFSMPNTFWQAFPPLPPTLTKTLVGVEISDAKVVVGDATSTTNKNVFRGINIGVASYRANTTVKNCRFAKMNVSLFYPLSGTGIYAEGEKQTANPPFPFLLKVGGNLANEICYFDSCQVGINARKQQTIDIQYNSINNCRNFGVTIQSNNQRGINISNNTLNQTANYTFSVGTAINVVDAYNSNVFITGNNISQKSSPASAQVGTGIRVSCVLTGIVNLVIANNLNIQRFKTGIWLQNIDGRNTGFVTTNTVKFQKNKNQFTTMHYGIRLEGCIGVTVDHNTISRSTGNWALNDQANAINLRGISVESSPTSLVYQNTLTRMGDGIYATGVSSSSVLACNDLTRCYNGFNFAAADIGRQILDQNGNPTPTGNTWTNSTNKDLNGLVTPAINWYYTGAAPVNGMLFLSFILPANGPQSLGNTPDLCGTIYQLPPAPVQQREQAIGDLVARLQNNPSSLSPQETYFAKKYAHRMLKQNPNWLNLNTPQDAMYQNFFAAEQNTATGLTRTIEEQASIPNQGQVVAVNTSIPVSSTMDDNLKTVTEIYSRSWLLGVFEFSAADSLTLWNIATLNAPIEGSGVYAARAILNISVDDATGNVSRLGAAETESQPTQNQTAAIYPNPATNEVTVSFELTGTENGLIEIFDLTGKLILSKQSSSNQTNIDVSSFVQGVYMIRIAVNGEARYTERLVIVK